MKKKQSTAAAGPSGQESDKGAEARRVAIGAVARVMSGSRTASALAGAFEQSDLDDRDRAFVTEMVNGAVRMQRCCDHLIDKHVNREPDNMVRSALRVGTYQLVFLGTPPHAAVSATVAAVAPKVRGFVNAVLRRVGDDVARGGDWPSLGVELSYPDWLIDRLIEELGETAAIDAMAAMNDGEQAKPRSDGYVQGASSAAVVTEVAAQAGELVVDVCAAPGGKTTAMAVDGATVVGLDIGDERCSLLRSVCERWGQGRASAVRADAIHAPIRREAADRVLVDAPCSGLGALGRRSDARWRVREGDIERLGRLQSQLLESAAELVRPGGILVYSVCTVTKAETLEVASRFEADVAGFSSLDLVAADDWREFGRGGLILPQDRGTDGMAVFRWKRNP